MIRKIPLSYSIILSKVILENNYHTIIILFNILFISILYYDGCCFKLSFNYHQPSSTIIHDKCVVILKSINRQVGNILSKMK